jgi:hypothetical protein
MEELITFVLNVEFQMLWRPTINHADIQIRFDIS